jgi:sugar O-acyltransferase (sialic acid O-acetyltransferase NeuD family)
MTDRLVIVGAGGHGREALAVARSVNRLRDRWHTIGLVDDGEIDTRLVDEDLVLGTTRFLIDQGDEHVIAVGDPGVRRVIARRIGDAAPAVALVDPSAWVGDDVDLDEGAMLYPGAICTTNVRVGFHTHVNCGAIVSHDCRLGDFVSLSPGVKLNGGVTVGDGAFLGTGAIVLPGRSIGQDAVVGAGAVVVDDVRPGATVIGAPAR